MDDDDSWHGSDVKAKRSTRRKRKVAERRRGRPREPPAKASKREPKAPRNGAGERRRGRGRASRKTKAKSRDSAAEALPPSKPGAEHNEANVMFDPRQGLSEEVLDKYAAQYVDAIQPDLSTVVGSKVRDCSLPCTGRQYPCCEEEPTRRRRGNSNRGIALRGPAAASAPGRRSGCSRHMSSPDDTCVVPKLPPGPLADLLPPGTRVRRPAGKLVQLVAQIIHESPVRALRVQHVYNALQNKYPYFRFMSKKEITTWKSSIRHALFQKWFKKVELSPPAKGEGGAGSRSKSNFWSVNYDNRPREWDMPEGTSLQQVAGEVGIDSLCADLACGQSPRLVPPPFQEPAADFGVLPIPMSTAWSQEVDERLGMKSPLPSPQPQHQVRAPYQVWLQPQEVTQQQQQPKQDKQEKKQQQLLQHQEPQLQHQRLPTCPTPIPLPPASTPQSFSAGSTLMSSPWRPPALPPLCSGIDEFSAVSQLSPRRSQGADTRPGSRLSTSSVSISSHDTFPAFLSSPGRRPSQAELQLQYLGDQVPKMGLFAAPPSPSVYIRTKQEREQPPLDLAWSGGPFDLCNSRSPRSTDELSKGSDSQLWNEHLYAKRSDPTAPFGAGGPLAPPPFLCSPRLTHDMPEPPAGGGGCRIPLAQQKPQLGFGQQFISRPEASFSEQQLQQQRERMMFHQQLPSRPAPPYSREGTLPQQEPPRHELRSPPGQSPLRTPDSTAPPEPPFSGRWVAGARLWPSAPFQKLPLPTESKRPVYTAIAKPLRMLCMEDGTPYILGYPTFGEDHPWAAKAKWHWQEYPRMGLHYDHPCQYTVHGRRADALSPRGLSSFMGWPSLDDFNQGQ